MAEMQIKVGPNFIGAALTLVATGAAMNWPGIGTLLMIGGAMVFISGVRVDGWRFGFGGTSPWRAILALIATSVLLTLALWYHNNIIYVYPPFSQSYNHHADLLGKPIGLGINSAASNNPKDMREGAGFTWTDNAYVIWMRNPGIMIACPKAVDQGTFLTATTDYAHDVATEPELWDDRKINDKLPRKMKHPPHGSLAYSEIHNYSKWGWVGETQRQCAIDGEKVFYQKFEHGIIYGLFRVSPSNRETQDSMIFTVLDDGAWFRDAGNLDAPKILGCEDGKP